MNEKIEAERTNTTEAFISTPGAVYLGDQRCRFAVWAPFYEQVAAHLFGPQERMVVLERNAGGGHVGVAEGVEPGTLYKFRLEAGKELPDPASRYQPRGVHGPSGVVDPGFPWDDRSWFGLPLERYIIYELHVGTFTSEGTFSAIIPQLDELKGLGVTAVELMPVAQFPGNRNWGYDGVYPFAVQDSYGGPEGLKRLVNACHQKGLALVLDVVYNHLGPEGNYLGNFGPYFTDRYKTPWGPALNFDGPDSDEVRRFFIENALYWFTEFHVDALRLDAVHAILDYSPRPFLQELAVEVGERSKRLNRQIYLIPESASNDARLIRSHELGGYGLHAQWSDDFHHSLRVLLTGDRTGYYQDYGKLGHLVKAFREGFVYSGEYSAYRRHRHGSSSKDIPAERFVVFSQNHDQVGNRMLGERLSQTVSFEDLKLAAGVVLLSPFVPLLFMGEEYGETAPFQYFISHSDPELVEAVRHGRREEFAAFRWQGEPPDPQDEATFHRAKLNHDLRRQEHHQTLLEFYRELIRLRNGLPALTRLAKENTSVVGYEKEKVVFVHRWNGGNGVFALFNFSQDQVSLSLLVPDGRWRKQLDSADRRWRGGGSSLPAQVESTRETAFPLRPRTLALFASGDPKG